MNDEITLKKGKLIATLMKQGAMLSGLYHTSMPGYNFIDFYETTDALQQNKGAKSNLLAPFPNRIDKGKYKFKNIEYQLPINKPNEENAIHGFIRDKHFTLVNTGEDEAVLVYNYDGSEAGYPFPFKIDAKYEVTHNGLTLHLDLTNVGVKELPVGLGWHPYLKWKGGIENADIFFPPSILWKVNSRMIPTGESERYRETNDWVSLKDLKFDDCFTLEGTAQIEVRIPETGISVKFKNLYHPFFQVYTPSHRQSIAIEPMTCLPDAFNNGNGLTILPKGEKLRLGCTININNTLVS